MTSTLIWPLYEGALTTDVNSTEPDGASILVVEDERDLADMYASYLRDGNDVTVVYGGNQAIDVLEDGFDVVLLDRRMPEVTGSEVLEYIEEASLTCRVAMVTAVNPDFDIIDLGIDDYLVKPVTREELLNTVARLVKLDAYNERMQELTAKKLKRNVLEFEKTKAELVDSDDFDALTREIAEIEREVESIADELDVDSLQEGY